MTQNCNHENNEAGRARRVVFSNGTFGIVTDHFCNDCQNEYVTRVGKEIIAYCGHDISNWVADNGYCKVCCPDTIHYSIHDENGKVWMGDETDKELSYRHMSQLIINFQEHYFFMIDQHDNILEQGGNRNKL
jgi:hypothetical protein